MSKEESARMKVFNDKIRKTEDGSLLGGGTGRRFPGSVIGHPESDHLMRTIFLVWW